MSPRAEPAPPSWGGQIEKKSFGGAKIRKKKKILAKIINFFFFGRTLGLGGAPPSPKVAPPLHVAILLALTWHII
jgi:hypothetical protein